MEPSFIGMGVGNLICRKDVSSMRFLESMNTELIKSYITIIESRYKTIKLYQIRGICFRSRTFTQAMVSSRILRSCRLLCAPRFVGLSNIAYIFKHKKLIAQFNNSQIVRENIRLLCAFLSGLSFI
jgi:hypothetical protein